MGYKFHKDSVTGFYCPGISTFDAYLTAVGITADSSGFLDTDNFLSVNQAPSTISAQYKDYYKDSVDGDVGLYRGILASGYSGCPYMGYIKIPYKVNGSNDTLQLVLPGTTPQMTTLTSISPSSGWVTVTRTSTALNVGSATYGKTQFADGVIPIFIAVECLGGGGGGSSSGMYGGSASAGITSGGGGGGGGFCVGLINLYTNPTLYFRAGAGGTASSKAVGGAGGNTIITNNKNAASVCVAYGGGGGTGANSGGSSGSSGGSGGSYAASFSASAYKGSSSTASSWTAWTGTSGGSGGRGGHGAGGVSQKAAAGSGVSNSGYFRTTPFLWPPGAAGKYFSVSSHSGGSVSGNEGGGGGGASQYSNGGNGVYNGKGGNGSYGSGGAGGDFKTGTWNSGGTGGDGWIYIYY